MTPFERGYQRALVAGGLIKTAKTRAQMLYELGELSDAAAYHLKRQGFIHDIDPQPAYEGMDALTYLRDAATRQREGERAGQLRRELGAFREMPSLRNRQMMVKQPYEDAGLRGPQSGDILRASRDAAKERFLDPFGLAGPAQQLPG